MSENKRYYWLKLNESFFEDDTIEWIEEQSNGEKYVLFYLKLCLRSLKDEGFLIRYVGEKLVPYDIKALSKLTNTDKDTVMVSLKLFEEIGLIERKETGEIYMKQINEMIGSETEVAKRVRKHRAKQLMLQSNTDETKCNTEKEKEKEKELEIDIRDRDKDREDKSSPTPYKEIKDLFNNTCKSYSSIRTVSKERKKHIKARWKQYDENLEVFKELFTLAEESNFLKGENNRNWKANFDWMMNENNMAKVLEGRYINEQSSKGTGKQSIDDEKFTEEDARRAGVKSF